MDIYLVRHPETIAPKGLCYGRLDLPLKEPVEVTRDLVLQQLMDQGYATPEIILASPLPRAKTLADSLASHFHLDPPLTDERLMELDFGSWEGRMWNDIPKEETEPWMADFVNQNAPGGESFHELSLRIDQLAQEWWLSENANILSKIGKQRLMVVSHSAPIRAILCKRKGLSLEKAFRLKVDFGSVHRISY
ncbi:histidine phosphatase family protein [Leptospira idonii]|uniref:Phosphoglycerate kinase n=1 Tax=Leptospira idonii TaxID=1193500 RepID=A0A4R9LZH4_9LEPT|nr:histidine phosphatase family protein [Leptospira idonii]TGN18895.1 phosphoglycerate kinase [Leptospira idonii]